MRSARDAPTAAPLDSQRPILNSRPMYRIRLPAGEERSFATIQELADAVRRGTVERESQIFHRRTGRWLPLESHPYFEFDESEAQGDVELIEQPDMDFDDMRPSAPAESRSAPEPPSDTASNRLPDESAAPPGAVEPSSPPAPAPLPPPAPPAAPAPSVPPSPGIAPTPYNVPPARPPEPRMPKSDDWRASAMPTPAPQTLAPPAGAALPDVTAGATPTGHERGRGLWRLTLIALVGAAGVAIGLKLRAAGGGEESAGPAAAPAYRPAPPPSSLLRPEADSEVVATVRALPVDRPLPDPTRPLTAEALAARRDRSFDAIRETFAREFTATGAPAIFSVRTTSSPEAARQGRRVVAAALNVIAAFHRREVMTDQAYGDTASFQRSRAGWGNTDIEVWTRISSGRASYQSVDLAQSLLADADSLLTILASNIEWQLAGDSIFFSDPSVAVAYRAQRARIASRRPATIADGARAVTLVAVRDAVDPAPLPVTPP